MNLPNPKLKKYACLIIDDEPIARKIVRNYCDQMPNLEVIAECKTALEALDFLANGRAEIIFLDIEMPQLNGLAAAKMWQKNAQIIFTTAFSEHAVESYEVEAADYLLKPFRFERFAKAVFRAIERLKNNGPEIEKGQLEPTLEPTFFIKSEGAVRPVRLPEILFCEAMKNYTRVVLADGQTLRPLASLSKMEADLAAAGGDFVRCHRSFLVSKRRVSAIGAGFLMLGEWRVPVGFLFKKAVVERFLI